MAVSSRIFQNVSSEIMALRRSPSSMSSAGSATIEEEKPAEMEQDVWKVVYKGEITNIHLEEMTHMLGLIKLCWDDVHFDFSNRNQFPDSYGRNTNKEKLLLWYANNFRKQFHVHFPKRRPLLLVCNNECGVQKMVSTTIRPTCMRYPELQHWQGCASFVSDHIQYTPLANPTALPEALLSPGEVLLRQRGHSFELATLLASLLIGASYNAFVVSGFASRDICHNDVTRSECPYLLQEEKVAKEPETTPPSKYALDPPRDLRSQFLLDMDEREKEKEAFAKRAQAEAEMVAIREFEKPPPDSLHTHRRHAWVLILPSKDVELPIFVEPASGVSHATNDPEFHGIDSVWNHRNYWVSVGNKRLISCKCLKYDLDNLRHWEHLLLGEPNARKVSVGKPADNESSTEATHKIIQSEKHLDMPASWVSIIDLPNSDYSRRYFDCKRTVKYRKCIVEMFSPYSDAAGLKCKVTHYNDYECTDVREVREVFNNRSDLMYYCSSVGSHIHHRFNRGRQDALKEHWYKAVDNAMPEDIEIEFYHQARMDCLSSLTMTFSSLREVFKYRTDFLSLREVFYGADFEGGEKGILKIREEYSRNKSKPASEDIARVEYDYVSEKVQMQCHYDDEHISAASRELSLKEMKQVISYEPSPLIQASRPLTIYRWLQAAVQGAKDAANNVRRREREIQELLVSRAQELMAPELFVSPFDEERNQEARDRYKERDRKIQEAEEKHMSMEVDLLAPYVAQLRNVIFPLPHDDARRMYITCLRDWKAILLARAIDIQKQFEQLLQKIEEPAEERGEGPALKDRRFKLHCLEVRLMRHKELAPQRYLALDSCLRSDFRLSNAFQ